MQWQGYEVGKCVVCIRAAWWDIPQSVASASARGIRLPRKGIVYTITEHFVAANQEGLFLAFAEVGGGRRRDYFPAVCFRPVDETRLNQFRKMLLTPPRLPVDA